MFKNIMNRRISAIAPNATRYQTASTTRLLSRPPTLPLRPQCQTRQIRAYNAAYQHINERFSEAKKGIWRKHPVLLPSMILFILTTIGTGFYFVYDYVAHMKPRFDRYPKPVSDMLRKAIYYTEIDLQPTQALAWYKQAMVVAAKVGMHPFSDEVLGIQFQIAAMLERAGMAKAAAEILEKVRGDCEEFVVNGRRKKMIREKEREIAKKNRRGGAAETDAESVGKEMEKEESEDKMRDEVMKKVQGMWLKLAELYGSDYINNADKMENALIQAVTVSRDELQRRKDLKLPVSDDQGKGFINLTHVATAYNELADFYVKKGKSNLAMTLYMQALSLLKEDQDPDQQATCAQVVLLNNISSQMAQQAQQPSIPRADTGGPPLSHEQLLHAASEWAKKALEVAAHIKPPVRDEECDQGCLVATYNLGEIAEMQENYRDARELYQTARKLAIDLKFEDGLKKADEALKRLKDNQ